MRAYYYDNLEGDQRLLHDSPPSTPVSPERLKELNVYYKRIPVSEHEREIPKIMAERGYKNMDKIHVSKEGLGEVYEAKIKAFFDEHLHEDEEIRYILSGAGFFDVRESPSDNWIRLAVEPGDLLIIPAGIYHRFTTDVKDDIQALRLFQDAPKWIAINRSPETEKNEHRIGYLQSIGVATAAA
ncbi:Acireductone dioxygenase [Schizophyllum commune H4-8]|uniref:Acireductone dioxygenase n=1 Tax=Schizophyllum commune (strain H4-8 / FGSC 9210) TaxID=578458 RepID=D8QAL0_SCHCM|nr:Acireductone dioxygenase [Schizophyllum commune H4-8]KAI5889948.1 Acireductone dioxygenase [Schizophyllum commune H4-8]